jgi:hypothetical protein
MEINEIEKSIPLRYRFQEEVNLSFEKIIENVKHQKEIQKPNFFIKHLDDHVWINFGKENRKYYAPHLHLELVRKDKKTTYIRGLYGPDPQIWTFFMFLHFFIALGFVLLSMLAYSHFSLNKSIVLEIGLLIFFVCSWFGLYFFAKSIRKIGIPLTHDLEKIKKLILNQNLNEK